MNIGRSPTTVAVLALVGLLAGPTILAADAERLTAEAEAAVRELFPDALVLEVGHESEQGVRYFEVALRNGDETIEMEVTADGSVGEVETNIEIGDVPQLVRDEIRRVTGGSATRVERHEIRGIPGDGSFARVDPPRVVYEVKYAAGGAWHELVVGADGRRLSSEESDDESSSGDSSEESSDDSSDEDDG
jgi:hypothetical protein